MDVMDVHAADRQRVIGFADVVRVPLRRWRLVVATTAAVAVATVTYLWLLPATYTAATVVVVRPVVTDPFTYPSGGADRAVNMTAENGIASGNDVIDATARATGRTADEVRDSLTVELPTGGQVLRFTYAARSEQQAIVGANTAAQAYLRVREEIYLRQRVTLLQSYDSSIRLLTEQRTRVQKQLPRKTPDSPSPATQAVLDQIRALNDQVAQLGNQRAKTSSADLSPGTVTAAARAPVPSSRDAAPVLLLGALLGGVLLGAITAHVREATDRRIRCLAQATDVTGLPALGVLRSMRPGGALAGADARYVALAVSRWVQATPPLPLVLLSSRADEGRTQLAGALAAAIAEAGHEVYLGAAAERHDELRAILFAAQRRTPPLPGITLPTGAGYASSPLDAPSGTDGQGATRPPSRPYGGGGTADDTTATGRRLLTVLVGAGSVRLGPLGRQPSTGVVVIDAPPTDTDERGVRAAQSGVAVLTVACDRTRHIELRRLVERLSSAGGQAVGFVLTGGWRG